MIISPIVSKAIISPNKSRCNTKKDTISLHVTDGNISVDALGNLFKKSSVQASSNYGVDSKGNRACYVYEDYRSWCTSSRSNDERAITIEIANDGGKSTGYHVSDKAIASTIELLVDICKRNNIPQLKWKGDKSLIGQVDKQNMTVHRWFKNKACPGDYLYSLHPYIASEVNKQLGIEYIPNTKSYMAEGVDWQYVFDPAFYANYNGDVRKAFGYNENALFLHFMQFGMNEQRIATADFNVKVYRANYTDLQKAFGDNWKNYYWHYCLCGRKENRKTA